MATCGVPQGSVLGPLLWDVACDYVLRTELPTECRAVCYADDTCIVASGGTVGEAIAMAEFGAFRIIHAIKRMGLQIAAQKTKAIIFGCDWPVERSNAYRLIIDGIPISIATEMKYLGLRLDSNWSFRPHFQLVAPRAERVSVALGRLLPNLRGPDERVRKLYVEVVHSVLLYGAPVWAPEMSRIRPSNDPIRRIQRRLAIRVIRACTVSYAAATALARIPPIDLLATALKTVFDQIKDARLQGLRLTERAVDALRQQAKQRMVTE